MLRPAIKVQITHPGQDLRHHVMWPCDIAPTDEAHLDSTKVLRHTQMTDAYLLALAVRHQGRLVTFDRGISVSAATGAEPDQLFVL